MGTLPELDDAQVLDKLGEFEYQILDELTQALLAKTFFFELDEEPILTNENYDCQRSVLCCKYNMPGIVQQIMTWFPNT